MAVQDGAGGPEPPPPVGPPPEPPRAPPPEEPPDEPPEVPPPVVPPPEDFAGDDEPAPAVGTVPPLFPDSLVLSGVLSFLCFVGLGSPERSASVRPVVVPEAGALVADPADRVSS